MEKKPTPPPSPKPQSQAVLTQQPSHSQPQASTAPELTGSQHSPEPAPKPATSSPDRKGSALRRGQTEALEEQGSILEAEASNSTHAREKDWVRALGPHWRFLPSAPSPLSPHTRKGVRV